MSGDIFARDGRPGDALRFRQARRNYGLRVPLADVPAHLACGWRLAEPDLAHLHWSDGRLQLAPPPCFATEDDA